MRRLYLGYTNSTYSYSIIIIIAYISLIVVYS